MYSLLIGLPPTILPSNKVHYRGSPEAYEAFEQPPFNRDSTPSMESSNKVHPLFDTITFDCTFEAHDFFVRHLRILLTWLSCGHGFDTIIGITTLYNGMILFTLSISSRDFALDFPKGLVPMEMYSLLIGLPPNNPQQSSPWTKYTIESSLRPVEPSNSLLLIEARLLFWSSRTKYTLCSTLESLLTAPSRLTTFLFDI